MTLKMLLLFGSAISLAGCQTSAQYNSKYSTYCDEKPAVCLLVGALVVGGVIAIASNKHRTEPEQNVPSDIRLKQNIRYVETLENGVRLHSYQYRGDQRYFVGVLAQELLDIPDFSSAVSVGKNGYYRVDYNALGLELAGYNQMNSAGKHAVKLLASSN